MVSVESPDSWELQYIAGERITGLFVTTSHGVLQWELLVLQNDQYCRDDFP